MLEAAVVARGGSQDAAIEAGALVRRFNVYEASSTFNVQVAQALTAYNTERGVKWDAEIPLDVRARIRSEIATRMFTRQHDRAPTGARELDGFVERASRQATSAVAGYDLTFSPVKSVSTLWALAPTRRPRPFVPLMMRRSPTRWLGWSVRWRSLAGRG